MLDELRLEMNDINGRMLALFERRMALSIDIAKEKQHIGAPVRDEKRELDTINAVSAKAAPEIKDYAKELFECLMSLSRQYQQRFIEKESEHCDEQT